jgi:drug/metabolite transporter (DMT)-like permease
MSLRGRSALPVLFVLMWCGGYVFGSIGTKHADPLAFTFWRFAVAATVLTTVAVATRAPWPRTAAAWRSLVLTGLSMQALFYSTGYLGMSLGVPAGLSALIGGLSPLAVAAAGSAFLDERLTRRQWTGSLLGVAGVVLAVLDRLGEGRIGVGVAFTLLGSVGFTAGTLLQRRHGAGMDLRTGGAVQFGVAALAVLPVALVHGGTGLPMTFPVLGGSDEPAVRPAPQPVRGRRHQPALPRAAHHRARRRRVPVPAPGRLHLGRPGHRDRGSPPHQDPQVPARRHACIRDDRSRPWAHGPVRFPRRASSGPETGLPATAFVTCASTASRPAGESSPFAR